MLTTDLDSSSLVLSKWRHLGGHDDLQQDRAEPDDLVNLRQLLLRLVPVSGVQGALQ